MGVLGRDLAEGRFLTSLGSSKVKLKMLAGKTNHGHRCFPMRHGKCSSSWFLCVPVIPERATSGVTLFTPGELQAVTVVAAPASQRSSLRRDELSLLSSSYPADVSAIGEEIQTRRTCSASPSGGKTDGSAAGRLSPQPSSGTPRASDGRGLRFGSCIIKSTRVVSERV